MCAVTENMFLMDCQIIDSFQLTSAIVLGITPVDYSYFTFEHISIQQISTHAHFKTYLVRKFVWIIVMSCE